MTPNRPPLTRWGLLAVDFAGSVLLGATAIWAAMLVVNLLAAFVRWSQPGVPTLGFFRFAIVVSAGLEVWHRWRKAKGK